MRDILAPDNRLLPRIEHARKSIAAGVRVDNGEPIPPGVDLAVVEKNLDNTLAEHFSYQQLQAQAHASGRLTSSEAHTIYAALGEVPDSTGWASGTDLATKVVVTEVMLELAMARRRS